MMPMGAAFFAKSVRLIRNALTDCNGAIGKFFLCIAVQNYVNGEPGMIEAVKKGDAATVRGFLREHPERINDIDVCGGCTLLQQALEHGQLAIVKLLIDNGASVAPKDASGYDVLDYLKRPRTTRKHKENLDEIAALVRQRAEEEFKDNERSPAWALVKNQDNDKLAELLKDKRFNVDIQNRHRETLVFHAFKCDNPEAARLLMERGGDYGAGRQFIENASLVFQQKAEDERLDAMRQKLKSGMAVDAAEPQTGKTALMRACEAGDVAMVYCLVANGAQPRLQDKNGKDAYAYARGYHPESDQLLAILDGAGKEPSAPPPAPAAKAPRRAATPVPANLDADERDPAWGFIRGGDNAQLAQWLESNKFNPNLQNRSGESLLFCALKAANLEAVKLLVAHGADRDLPDSRGRTPAGCTNEFVAMFNDRDYKMTCAELDMRLRFHEPILADATADGKNRLIEACENGDVRMAAFLVSRGADPRKKDKNGKDAYDYARERHPTSDRMITALDQAGQMFE